MSSAPTPTPILRAARHARLRWLGVGLFLAGALALGAALAGLPLGITRIGDVFVCLFATGLGLGTFGSHNDTALALLRDNRWAEHMPKPLMRELDGEILFDRLSLSELEATPRTAWFITVVAPLVLLWAVSRLVL
jgi:hypothetical protein